MKARLAVFLLLLLTWPLTFRYTSVGVDTERAEADTVRQRFWRVRWPGDGSVMVGWIDEHRRPEEHALEAVDLGGVFLRPPKPLPPQSLWNRLGFWWVTAMRGADAVFLVGVPHWLLMGIAGAFLVFPIARTAR